MARRVFLHIGLPKTGTTFLQTVMWHNKRRLRRQGVLYPGSRRMDHYRASQVVRDVPAGVLGEHAGAWESLVTSLEEWPKTGVISHEFFSMASASQAERAVSRLEPAEVHVVVTARDYVRQFPAVWQEGLKMHRDLTLDEFMDGVLERETRGAWGWDSQDIPAVLNRWGKAVPADRVHLVTVPRPGAPRDLLWRRWCEVLGLDADAFDLDVAFGNESLGAAQAALLQRVKPYLSEEFEGGAVRHRWFRQYFGHEVLVPQAGERFGLRSHHADALRAMALEAVRSIEDAGYDVVGDLDELVPDAAPEARPHPDDYTDAQLLEVAGVAIEKMIRDVRDLTMSRDGWRRRALAAERPETGTNARRAMRRCRRLAGKGRRFLQRARGSSTAG